MTRARAARLLVLVLPVLALPVVGSSPARASAPVRTGWWDTGPVPGLAPSTTPDGDLHVALGPAGTLAYAAVSYHVPTYPSAVLVLHVDGTPVGTPALLACPTRTDTWRAGGDQDGAAAPAFDCAARGVSGVVGTDSAGAATVSFQLDAGVQLAPGTTALALVPAAGPAPFSLDLAAPAADSLVAGPVPAAAPATSAPVEQTDPVAAAPDPLPADPPVPGAPQPGTAGVEPAVRPPAALPGASVPPSPQVAPPQAAPLAQGAPLLGATAPLGSGRRSALALLVVLLAGAACTVAQRAPAPRLLGGRAHAAGAEPPGPSRGLNQFRRPRTGAARRLT